MIFLALIADTFREAAARRIFWGMTVLSTIILLFFAFLMRIDVIEGAKATIALFGGEGEREIDLGLLLRQAFGAVSTVLYSIGMFLSVFAAAGLTPSQLEPGRIELLLSKPVSRVTLLLGRYVGNLLLAAGQFTYLVLGTWLILASKTEVWDPHFLWVIPVSTFLFAVLLAVVVWASVIWESTAVASMAALSLLLFSPVLAQNDLAERLLSSAWSRQVWKVLYWTLPKSYELGQYTVGRLYGHKFDLLETAGSTAIFGTVLLAAAVWTFMRRDY